MTTSSMHLAKRKQPEFSCQKTASRYLSTKLVIYFLIDIIKMAEDETEQRILTTADGDNVFVPIDRPFRSSLILSLSYFAIFTAYSAIQNLQTSLNPEHNLGVTSLASLYGTMIISGIFAPVFIQYVGAKLSVIIAWIAHMIYTLSNFYPTWGTLIPSSVILGWMSAPVWICQGLYLSAMSTAYAREIKLSLHASLSRLNGVFFMIFAVTQISGNLISSLLLNREAHPGDPNVTCGARTCPSAHADNSTSGTATQPSHTVVYSVMGTFLACQLVGFLLTVLGLPPLPKAVSRGTSLMSSCGAWCSALGQGRLLLLLPMFLAQTMNQGILITEYTKSFVTCTVGIFMVGFAMTSYGVADALSAFLINRAARYTGRIPLFLTASAMDLATQATMLYWVPGPQDLRLLFVLPIAGGVSDGILGTQNNSLIAMVFAENKPASFAVYHTLKAVGFCLTFTTGIFLCVATRLYLSLSLYALGLLGYLTVELLTYFGQKDKILYTSITD